MRTVARLFAALTLAVLSLSSTSIAAEPSTYIRVLVGKHVSIESPSHWGQLSADDRRNLAAAGEAITRSVDPSTQGIHVASLAVNATPAPTGAIIRVSYVQDSNLGQQELRRELRENRNEAMRELEEVYRDMLTKMDSGMRAQGLRVIEGKGVRIEEVGGMSAIVFAYRRSSANGPSPWTVTQYHIPIGSEKVLVTLSHRESDGIVWRPILERVKNSIVVR